MRMRAALAYLLELIHYTLRLLAATITVATIVGLGIVLITGPQLSSIEGYDVGDVLLMWLLTTASLLAGAAVAWAAAAGLRVTSDSK